MNLEELQSQLETAVLSTVKEVCKAAYVHLATVLNGKQQGENLLVHTACTENQTLPENNRIQLNIGGQRFTTTRETLLSENDTFFHSLASSEHWKPDQHGEYFIDRDPSQFGHILAYLRQKATVAPDDDPLCLESFMDHKKLSDFEKRQLISDIDFYCMSGMAGLMGLPQFVQSGCSPVDQTLTNCTAVRCSSLYPNGQNPSDLLGPTELPNGVMPNYRCRPWIEFEFDTAVTLTKLILTIPAWTVCDISDFTLTGHSEKFHHDWSLFDREATFELEIPCASVCHQLIFDGDFCLSRVQLFGYTEP
eukprot:TRINITY_DN67879_c0_g2_i18.p1 TRINITY_DN67879_c0_g2~~TRINITY_DN67879_c0_g2_i18.p1  ORF type:complete len:306 (-),score=35.13 TRINITY_DN67879_c0_g2_i18:25-942(-)